MTTSTPDLVPETAAPPRMAVIDAPPWREALARLERHPFQQLQLASREKFHTAMLAHVLSHPRIGRPVFEEITEQSVATDLRAVCEHASMDLIIVPAGGTVSDPWIGVVEMKYGTRLHSDQLHKYAAKIERHRRQTGGDDPKRLLISLFEPRVPGGIRKIGFRRIDLLDEVLRAVAERCVRLNGDDGDALVRLWVDYLENIRVLRAHLEHLGTNADPEFGTALRPTKLRGLFEEQRLLPSRDRLVEALGADLSKKAHPLVVVSNTHGNPLVETNFWPVTGVAVKYGLQWQAGNLKLFVSFEGRRCRDEAAREQTLKSLADRLRAITEDAVDWGENTPWSCNRTGRFRSVTVLKWDPWGDVSDRPREFAVLARALREDGECRRIVVELIERGSA